MGRTAVCGTSEYYKAGKLRRIRWARQAAGWKRREMLKHCGQNTRRLGGYGMSSAADLHLRPRDHTDRHFKYYCDEFRENKNNNTNNNWILN